MARIRTVKPEFWTHEDLSALPEATHMLAAALLNYADDEGYFNANPGLIKAACFPLRDLSVSVQDSLNMLVQNGFVRIGVGTDGKRYGQVVTFNEHQRVNRPTPSKIKALNVSWEVAVTAHTQLTDQSPPERNREQGREEEKNSCAAPPSPAPAESDAPSKPNPEKPSSPVFIAIPLNSGEEYPITESDVTEFRDLYPAVDVPQALRNIRGWALANPTKRKTRAGVRRFVNAWLSKDQDKGKQVVQLHTPARAFREVSL